MLRAPAAAGLIVRLGPGNQYFPWIHIDDLCNVYLKAVKDKSISGPFNAAAPDFITHDMLMSEIARQKHLPVFLPHVPQWLLRIMLGEMSVILITGSRVSSDRLVSSGFGFRYPDIGSALRAC
jgi:NAD dependent epimerase/dehydratase family enzyme